MAMASRRGSRAEVPLCVGPAGSVGDCDIRSGCYLPHCGAAGWPMIGSVRGRAETRMTQAAIKHSSVAERKALGKRSRDTAALTSHAGWTPAADRPDPVALLEEQNVTREQDLVPVRHGRMMVSPFTFYRGAAKIMAADLKDTPRAGLIAQLCGDAHLSNFGVFASPERALLFDLNDFDETLPGPFEYDVKRMSASFTIAGRNNGFTTADARAVTLASVRAYRESMARFAQMAMMDIIRKQFRSYRATLQSDRRQLMERFEIIDVARKVVGVGSVGTRAFIILLQGRDQRDPLFLQLKEATASVLEDHLPKSRFKQPGERVVHGQRMMQAASDIFLGWTKGVEDNRYLYWRQLRDMKGSVVIESMAPHNMEFYANACGWTLARAHARSGDAVAIAGYLGKGDRFDRSITDFSERYADQNEQDYEAFVGAVRSGRLEAIEGL